MRLIFILFLCVVSSMAAGDDFMLRCHGGLGSGIEVDYSRFPESGVARSSVNIPEKDFVRVFKYSESSPDELMVMSDSPEVISPKAEFIPVRIVEKSRGRVVALYPSIGVFYMYIVDTDNKSAIYFISDSSRVNKRSSSSVVYAKCEAVD
jgi:hypothetical protein